MRPEEASTHLERMVETAAKCSATKYQLGLDDNTHLNLYFNKTIIRSLIALRALSVCLCTILPCTCKNWWICLLMNACASKGQVLYDWKVDILSLYQQHKFSTICLYTITSGFKSEWLFNYHLFLLPQCLFRLFQIPNCRPLVAFFFFSFKSFPTGKNNKITLHLGLELYVHFLLCSDGFALIMVFIGRWNLLTTLKHVHFTLAYLEYLKDFMLALNLSLMFILVHQKKSTLCKI